MAATQKKKTTSATDTVETADNNYIKMDGEFDSFEGGAIRYTKTGKGRFDLIPGEIITQIVDYAFEQYYSYNDTVTVSCITLLNAGYGPGPLEHRALDVIINLIIYEFADVEYDNDDETGLSIVTVDSSEFIRALCTMLKHLAIHYENGAEKYGADNWKKGIPCTGGDKGGSFLDSGLRHLNQYLLGYIDEHHAIASIWNFIGILWNMYHGKYSED